MHRNRQSHYFLQTKYDLLQNNSPRLLPSVLSIAPTLTCNDRAKDEPPHAWGQAAHHHDRRFGGFARLRPGPLSSDSLFSLDAPRLTHFNCSTVSTKIEIAYAFRLCNTGLFEKTTADLALLSIDIQTLQ